MRYKLLRVAVAAACFIAGVCVGYIQRYVQQQLSAPANQTIELPTSSSPSTPVAPAQEETTDYPEKLGIEPYDIEFFIEQHPDANLEPLWRRLKINDDDDPIADFSFSHSCGFCTANAFKYNLDDDAENEVVLQIKQQLGESYRYLVFKGARGDWKLLGHIDVWAKYPPSDPVVFVSNGKAWLVVQSTAGTGSGLGAWLDTVYEVSSRGVRRVASYLGEVTQSGFQSFPSKVFVARPVSCEIKNGRVTLTVSYTVEYFGALNDDFPLFTKQKKAVLVGSLKGGSSSIDATQSEITPHEFETIYNFDSMGPEEFLQYNRAELRNIATGKDSEKKQWLEEFLNTCDNGALKRELLTLSR